MGQIIMDVTKKCGIQARYMWNPMESKQNNWSSMWSMKNTCMHGCDCEILWNKRKISLDVTLNPMRSKQIRDIWIWQIWMWGWNILALKQNT